MKEQEERDAQEKELEEQRKVEVSSTCIFHIVLAVTLSPPILFLSHTLYPDIFHTSFELCKHKMLLDSRK